MTLKEKLKFIMENCPELYDELSAFVPSLIRNPSSASRKDIDRYNYFVLKSLDEDIAKFLYQL